MESCSRRFPAGSVPLAANSLFRNGYANVTQYSAGQKTLRPAPDAATCDERSRDVAETA